MTDPQPSHLHRLGRSLVTLHPAPGRARRAVRWVAAIAVGLIATSLILGPAHGALGLLGAQASGAGRDEPLRRRLRIGLAVGSATLASQAVGLLISPYPWLVPPVMTVMSAVIIWTWHALQVGPPGPINTVFAGAFGTFMGTLGWTVGTLLPITGLAWLLATLASVLLLQLDPHAPERESVEGAEAAVAAYRETPTPDEDDSHARRELSVLRSRAWIAVDGAWHVLRTGRTPGTVPASPSGRALEKRLRAAHLALVTRLQEQSFPADRLSIAEYFDLVPMGMPSARYLLGTAAHRGSRAFLVAMRAAVAVLLASSLAYLSPWGHPYWAILSAIIVLHMGASRVDLTIRAAHRVIGTGVGVLVYLGIVSLQPGAWLRLAIVVLAIYGLEALVVRNYAIAVVFVTVFALMLTPTSSEAAILVLMRDRLIETIIGAGSAALVTWLVGRKAPVLLVRQQYRLTLRTLTAVLADLAAGRRDVTAEGPARELVRMGIQDQVRTHRRFLVFELGRSGALLAGQRPDAPAELGPWTQVQRAVDSLGFDAVAATWREPGQGSAAAQVAVDELRELLHALPPISSRNIDPAALAGEISSIHTRFLEAAPGGR